MHHQGEGGEEDDTHISVIMSDEGFKVAAKSDYTSKFKEVNWTCEINHELPLRIVLDRTREASEEAKDRTPGSETPITVSQAFLNRVQHMGKFECMRKLSFTPDGKASTVSISWQMYYDRAV